MTLDIRWNFALVDGPSSAGITPFEQAFARNDYRIAGIDGRLIGSVLSFELSQDEGDFATLRITVANPRSGLLNGPTWLWFSYGINGGAAVPLFFGRLMGIPSSILQEVVELEFIARPTDYASQKAALAETLRVLPYYDPAFIDKQRRDDPDAVLEGYTKLFHVNRLTLEVSTSDVLDGEDGVEEFTASEMLARGLGLGLDQIPLARVTVDAELPWTQRAFGTIDLTSYIVSRWPNEGGIDIQPGTITSFALKDSDWPKPNAGIGSGWTVADGVAIPVYDLTVKDRSSTAKQKIDWGQGSNIGWYEPPGGTTTAERTDTAQYLDKTPPGSIELGGIVTQQETQIQRSKTDHSSGEVTGEITGYNHSVSATFSIVPLIHLRPTLTVTYAAERPRTERVSFTLSADVQPLLTEPGDDEALLIAVNAEDLSEPIDVSQNTTGFEAPIGDPRRRSYVVTPRGELTLQYLVCLARAPLVRRSRAAKVTFEPISFERMAAITLRKNARIHDNRLPGGVALGKIISYRVALDGNSGMLQKSVTMGCAVGRGGNVAAVTGDPIYVEEEYIGTEEDYQEYDNRRIVFDSGVAYEPMRFEPLDDGFDFIAGLTVDDVIEQALSVENPPASQRAVLVQKLQRWSPYKLSDEGVLSFVRGQEAVDARTEDANALLESIPTIARFKLKDMKASFEQQRSLNVSDLKIPKMIDIEAA